MAGFSGILQLTDLDDFITPSQECVKPDTFKKTKSKTGAKISIQEGDYVQLQEDGQSSKLQKVEITLADCLACSGCITTAESVLVSQQSQEELLRIFAEKAECLRSGREDEAKLIVISVSVQPILSLAERYQLEPTECAQRLAGYFKHLGADMIVDMSIADDLVLLEVQKEFLRRYQNVESENVKNILPMLASSCPGFVCYAEKTHGNFILPYISTTKSPQQVMGSLIKDYVAKHLGSRQIYHVTVMPCFDKKLEAAREDFFNEETQSRDVDCVITSIELEQMLAKDGSLNNFEKAMFSQPWLLKENSDQIPDIISHAGSGSGGYCDHIYRYAAKELFNMEIDTIEYKNLRNPDFKEAILEKDGKILRFAIANGFRNIQNLVQKLKRGKSTYHYVEIMACPSGCLNGGAQVRPTTDVTSKELVNKLEKLYTNLPIKKPEENIMVKKLYDNWLAGQDSDKCVALLHTQYHEIEKLNTSLNIKW